MESIVNIFHTIKKGRCLQSPRFRRPNFKGGNMAKQKTKFIDFNLIYSYECIFNYLIGGRNAGKTYGFKKRGINDFLTKGKQFIYMRRYGTELKGKDNMVKPVTQFFDDIIKNEEFPGHEYKVKGGEFFIDDKVCGYYFPLSVAKKYKSTSFPLVDLIGYDEFIIKEDMTTRYLQNEVEDFLEMYETIARPLVKPIPTKVFFMSNNISYMNPYFDFFNLLPKEGKEFSRINGQLICYPKSVELEQEKNATPYYQMLSKTPNGRRYITYANGNESLVDNDDFIEKKSMFAKYMYTVIFKDKKIGVWVSFKEGKCWLSNDIDESKSMTFTLTLADLRPNTMLIKSSTSMLKMLKDMYKTGSVYYESKALKSAGQQIYRIL